MRKAANARFLVLLVAVGSVLAAGCGARLSDDQVAALANANQASSDGLAAGNGGTNTGGTNSGGTNTGGTEGQAGSEGSTSGGTGGDASGPGGESCTAQPSTEVGVTDTSIAIGNVSTIGGPIPGFGQTGVNGTNAYIAYANSQGGVCGRELRLVTADDGLQAGLNRSETQRLSSEVFGFAGSVTVVDDGGAAALQGTNIPDTTLSIGTLRAGLPNNFSPSPTPPNDSTNGTTALLEYFKNTYNVDSAAIIVPNQPDAALRANGYANDLAAAGIADVTRYPVEITEFNYLPVATDIQDHQTDLVLTVLEVNGMARLAQALQQVGYKPPVPFWGAQAYGNQFLQLAGAAAEGTILGLTFSIFEDADQNPAMATFVEWYERTNPGAPMDFFSVMSWAATDMMVQALRTAGPAPTRDAVIAALQGFTDYDADGLLSPRNPAAKTLAGCFVVVTVEGGEWRRVDPEGSGFVNC
jgi:ABC-type branched-subunit amino acid transport system substrate-binding protein